MIKDREPFEQILKQKIADGTAYPEKIDLWPHNYDGSFADVEYDAENRKWDFTVTVNTAEAIKVEEFLRTLAWPPEE